MTLTPDSDVTGAEMTETGWRDIASAPKDGSFILLIGGVYGGLPFVGRWLITEFCPAGMPWVSCTTGSRLYEHVPTHWMPLPDSPSLTRTPPHDRS